MQVLGICPMLGTSVHGLALLFIKLDCIVEDNLMLQNHLKGYPDQI